MRKTKICTGLMVACGGVLLSAGHPAIAQTTQSLERVEITGSNIKRVDAETASPVQIITKKEIDQVGKATIAEYLQTLTADGQGSVPFTFGRGFAGGSASGISLRGLGANLTLVLVNGRRLNSTVLGDDVGSKPFVDLNQIPVEAIERVEVLKDGASSIYGSDAIAGVVNIILRKNFVGTTALASYGMAEKGDGKEPRVALTHGFGDMVQDGYNVLLNLEVSKKGNIFYRDRAGRNAVGVSASGQPQWGLDPNKPQLEGVIARQGGYGWIPVDATGTRFNNSAPVSIVGNVRNPNTLDYYSRSDPGGVGFTRTFPGAATFCVNNANLPQNNPAGGCIIDQRQAVTVLQPEKESGSFFGRLTKKVTPDTEAFLEVGLYKTKVDVPYLANSPSGAYFTPDGVIHSQTAATALGAAHPDNPYFGTAARLMYSPIYDPGVGPSNTRGESHSERVVAGAKGTWNSFDFDTALNFSQTRQTDTSHGNINWRVKNALLNPTAANVAAATAFSPAYAALPAGTVWRIGENAGLNSPALYDALYADQKRDGFNRIYGADFRLSREIGQLEGGPIGIAFGAEGRHEASDLPLYSGFGDYIGLSYFTAAGKRNIYAAFTEVALPVLKDLELNAALRYDHYSDAGNSVTPKFGAKWRPLVNLAVRGTYAKGFRAPTPAENGPTSAGAFSGSAVNDNVRCAALAGLPQAVIDANCLKQGPNFVQKGNPNLVAEKSTSETLGLVWDVTTKSSLTADLWQIKRKGRPSFQNSQAAVDAGQIVRDPSTSLKAGDPGAILVVGVQYENASETLTNGFDIEAKHRMDLGDNLGGLTLTGTWTHLITQREIDADGTKHDFAGTHGNCDVTNCIGSPRDRLSFATTWDTGLWRLGANVNYRGKMSSKLEQSDAGCAQTKLDGSDQPSGCKLKSFTTLDISGAWRFGKNTEVFGSIANVFDTKPPVDFLTYGTTGYNPLDYSGAIGRYFRVGVKHQF